MNNLPKALTALAAVAFVLAVIASYNGGLMGKPPRTFGHACTNLALLAIAVVVTSGRGASTKL